MEDVLLLNGKNFSIINFINGSDELKGFLNKIKKKWPKSSHLTDAEKQETEFSL